MTPAPLPRSNQLDKAITPGPTSNSETHDYMWTTPQRLFAVLDGTIQAFDAMQVRQTPGKRPPSPRFLCPALLLVRPPMLSSLPIGC